MHLYWVFLTSLLLTWPCWLVEMSGKTPVQENEEDTRTEIALSINPVVDLHFHVRSLLHTEGEIPQEYAAVVEQAREFEKAADGPLGWGFIEPLLTRCERASELQQWAERLPERFRLRSGRIMKPRETSIPYAKALAKVESAFMKEVWPANQRIIKKASESLNRLLKDHGAAAVEYITKCLKMEIDRLKIPVFLVAQATPPGASTSASPGIGVVSFVGVSGFSDLVLAEVVLHEMIHALDLRSRGKPTALNRLREKLRQAGLPANDPRMRDIPHTVIFVQAAETVRRLIDATHEHYSHDKAFYLKTPEAANRVLPNWLAYLDNLMTLDEVLSAMINGLGEKAGSGETEDQSRNRKSVSSNSLSLQGK